MTLANHPSPIQPRRRRSDDPAAPSRRITVIWRADVKTTRHEIWSTVLDISPEGARLGIDTTLLGQVKQFRLEIEALDPINCTPVWQTDGHMGVRFLTGQPSLARLRQLIGEAAPDAGA